MKHLHTHRVARWSRGPAAAMATASRLFTAAHDTPSLLTCAAQALASDPGDMCLISLASPLDDRRLRPTSLAHAQPTATHHLQHALARSQALPLPADAFSRCVLRSGGSFRMRIGSSDLLRLWLPTVYWPYLERVRVSGVLVAALSRQARVLGTLLLWREGSQRPFRAADERYVSALAARLALAL